jgi:flagellar biosynthesis anti-sigma factor FlgM
MKVPGSEAKDAIIARVTEARAEKAAARDAAEKRGGLATELAASDAGAGDRVEFSSLGAILKSELNPSKMADERRAKIEALKAQIKNGTYQPPLENVAQAVGEEISLEVLLSGGALRKAE